MSRSIYDTTIPTLIVSRHDLGGKYPVIGSGCEGGVYNYNGKYALKTFELFRSMEYFYGDRVDLKFRKVEEMTKLKDPSIRFPVGILGYRDEFMEGCYSDLIEYEAGLKDFDDLTLPSNKVRQIDYLIKGDRTVKRAHDVGLIIGDIKEDNMMIDKEGNTILVDVDNCAYGDYPFDLFPDRAECYEQMHGKKGNYKDNDIMLYTLMVLRILFNQPEFKFGKRKSEIDILINHLPINKEIKEYIELLLSDAQNKPYVGPLLQKIREYNK